MLEMFSDCRNLTSLDVSGFNTSNVTNMGLMFFSCNKLTSLDVSGFNTSNVKNMGSMFAGCSNLTSLDVSGFNTSNVTDMGSMFWNCAKLTSLNISGFDTSSVTNMSKMFAYCYNLTSLDIYGFDTKNVTNMIEMFHGCSRLTDIDISSFDISNATNISWMFKDCSKLNSVILPNSLPKIDEQMFTSCALSSITCLAEAPQDIPFATNAFDESAYTDATLYVPVGTKALYETADGWKNFVNIVEMEETNTMKPANVKGFKGTEVVLPIEMNNEKDIRLFQFDLTLPEGVTVATNANGTMKATLTERAGDHVLKGNRLANGKYRFLTMSFTTSVFSGNRGAVVNLTLQLDEAMEPGEYVIQLSNVEMTQIENGFLSPVNPADTKATLTVTNIQPGDVSGDGRLTVTDVAMLVNYLLQQPLETFYVDGADVDGNGNISITDIATLVDLILSDSASAKRLQLLDPQ